jgi:DNA-binding NtrC family response regulator
LLSVFAADILDSQKSIAGKAACGWQVELTEAARILLVEDDEQVRQLVDEVLRDAGYAVDTASDVATAEALLASERFDLVLTDGRLPDGTGFSIAAKAVEKDIKILVCTGYGSEFSAEERSLYPILAKPVRPSELLLIIRHFLA